MKYLIYFLSAFACCAQLSNNYVRAIHQVETSGRLGPIMGDNGKALGPMQIHRSYFEDAKKFDKANLGTYNYQDVKRLDVSVKVMDAYARRYEPRAYQKGDFEALARLHNSGPDWKNKPRASDGYWNKVKTKLK